MIASPYIRAEDVCRYYRRGMHEVRALDHVSLTINKGDYLSIVGSSGSGKTTLLNLLAGLDTPTSGFVEFDGAPLSTFSQRQLASYRADNVGMIFQSFNLISHYTALQNVETALYFNNASPTQRRRLATTTLEQLGLGDRLTHRPADLSGGEQQRVAVARAIVKKPEILFADEPTGNLDYENASQISSIMKNLNNDGLTIVLVTHNLELAQQQSHRTIRMHYGHITPDSAAVAREGTPS